MHFTLISIQQDTVDASTGDRVQRLMTGRPTMQAYADSTGTTSSHGSIEVQLTIDEMEALERLVQRIGLRYINDLTRK